MVASVRRLAITGGIAQGKSTVLGYCAEAGISTISADDVAKQVLENLEVQREVCDAMGFRGGFERSQLREAVSSSSEARHRLNAVMHPHVWRGMLDANAQCWEVPLLYEACIQHEFDLVWCVTCGINEQLRRVTGRLGSRVEAERMIATQLPTRAKSALSNKTFRTNSPENDVRTAVLDELSQILWTS